MTVSTSVNKSGPYAGAGSTGPFTVGFRFLAASHLQVIRTSVDGYDTTLTLTTDYSVAGVGAATGSVTLVSALAVGEKLTVVRNVPFTQDADYVNNDSFPAESHEDALDKLVMLAQQLKERIDAALTLAASSSGVSATLPAPVGDTLLGWNTAGTALVNLAPTSSSVAVPQTGTSKSAVMPSGTTAERDSVPSFGYTRANSTNGSVEWWNGTDWRQLVNGVDGPLAGFRNLIINGDMRIGQRFGNATSMSVLANGSFAYTADRWMVASNGSGGGNTVQWSTGVTGQPFRTSLGVVALGGTMNNCTFRQRIEASNLNGLLGKTVTLSYKTYGTEISGGGPTTLTNASIYTPDALDTYTTKTAVSITSETLQAAGGGFWFTTTHTFTIPSGALGLEININVTAGEEDTWPIGYGAYITQVQLEEGTVATPFETRPYATELELCQRYLPGFYGINYFPSYAVNAALVFGILKFPVEARVAPTTVVQPPGSLTAHFQANGLSPSTIYLEAAGKSTATLQFSVSGATSGAPGFFGCLSGSGGLLFNGCEL